MEPLAKRTPHRLPLEAYRGQLLCSFTSCLAERKRLFITPDLVLPLVELLTLSAAQNDCLIPVYCFMPDHVHVVMFGTSDSSNSKAAMDRFKRVSGNWLRSNRPECRWQAGYYDHIIRSSRDWRRHVFYVANNPVRAGLVTNAFEYEFTGSFGMELGDVLLDASM